jgi:hypothetical protein
MPIIVLLLLSMSITITTADDSHQGCPTIRFTHVGPGGSHPDNNVYFGGNDLMSMKTLLSGPTSTVIPNGARQVIANACLYRGGRLMGCQSYTVWGLCTTSECCDGAPTCGRGSTVSSRWLSTSGLGMGSALTYEAHGGNHYPIFQSDDKLVLTEGCVSMRVSSNGTGGSEPWSTMCREGPLSPASEGQASAGTVAKVVGQLSATTLESYSANPELWQDYVDSALACPEGTLIGDGSGGCQSTSTSVITQRMYGNCHGGCNLNTGTCTVSRQSCLQYAYPIPFCEAILGRQVFDTPVRLTLTRTPGAGIIMTGWFYVGESGPGVIFPFTLSSQDGNVVFRLRLGRETYPLDPDSLVGARASLHFGSGTPTWVGGVGRAPPLVGWHRLTIWTDANGNGAFHFDGAAVHPAGDVALDVPESATLDTEGPVHSVVVVESSYGACGTAGALSSSCSLMRRESIKFLYGGTGNNGIGPGRVMASSDSLDDPPQPVQSPAQPNLHLECLTQMMALPNNTVNATVDQLFLTIPTCTERWDFGFTVSTTPDILSGPCTQEGPEKWSCPTDLAVALRAGQVVVRLEVVDANSTAVVLHTYLSNLQYNFDRVVIASGLNTDVSSGLTDHGTSRLPTVRVPGRVFLYDPETGEQRTSWKVNQPARMTIHPVKPYAEMVSVTRVEIADRTMHPLTTPTGHHNEEMGRGLEWEVRFVRPGHINVSVHALWQPYTGEHRRLLESSGLEVAVITATFDIEEEDEEDSWTFLVLGAAGGSCVVGVAIGVALRRRHRHSKPKPDEIQMPAGRLPSAPSATPLPSAPPAELFANDTILTVCT